MNFTIIAGMCPNNGIGMNGGLPWPHNKDDMKWFREITTKTADPNKMNVIVMGRTTWEKDLKEKFLGKRINIILSRKFDFKCDLSLNSETDNWAFCHSIEIATNVIQQYQEKIETVFIIGGASLYRAFIDHKNVNKMYITHFKKQYQCDTFFPEIRQDAYQIQRIVSSTPEIEVVEYSPNRSNLPTMEMQYLKIVEEILVEGNLKTDRTGVGTVSLFGKSMRMKFANGAIPLLTTKKTFFRGVITELLWFLRGSTNVRELREKKVHIWDDNSTRAFLDSHGLAHRKEWEVGPTYGHNFRYYGAPYIDATTDYTGQGVDQVAEVIRLLREDPNNRRIIINLWNPTVLKEQALPPCLFCYQYYVNNGKISCIMTQRSGDIGLGVPFNMVSGAVLLHIFGKLTGLVPDELIHNIGDTHVYSTHVETMREQIKRTPRPFPIMKINEAKTYSRVEDFTEDDFTIAGYYPYPALKMEMAV